MTLMGSSIKSFVEPVLGNRKCGRACCTYVFIKLSPQEYAGPERIARELARQSAVESVDIIRGDWEILAKVRVSYQDEHHSFVRKALSGKGIYWLKTLTSLKELKSGFLPS